MELTVYRQAIKERPNGLKVYKGEDAHPYVDHQLFFVADGMGGSAAIYHRRIVPEVFDSQKIMDVLFKGVYEDYSKETFVKYVTNSFFELFAVKDYYSDNINNVKKSGYFASRIVTAIVLHEMLYSEDYKAGKLFAKLSELKDENGKKKYADEIGQHFKQVIQTNLRKIAKNVNLVYESSFIGLALLGTTLCATIYLEHKDKVEAIYLIAGDSRPYVWTEKNGLCQVLKDQEGKDGSMTNYIKANDDADFSIQCEYRVFDKPCILFNASDGCFDSVKFASQLGFEKVILDSAISSETIEQMKEKLTSFFLEYGRHDDSSSIAMKIFGYASFENFKSVCENRMKTLQTEYFDKMSDLLDVDYISEYEECAGALPRKLYPLKGKFAAEQAVSVYCSDLIKAGVYQPYTDRISEIDKKIVGEKHRIETATTAITDIICANYIKFKNYINTNDTFFERCSLSRIESTESKHQETADDYVSRLQRYRKELSEVASTLKSLLDEIYQIGIPASFNDYDDIAFQLIENCEKTMDELFSFFDGLRHKKLDIVRKLTSQRRDYIEKNKKLAEKNTEDIKKLTDMVLSGNLDVSVINILEDEKAELTENIAIIKEAQANIVKYESEDKSIALTEAAKEYWEKHYIEVIAAVLKKADNGIDNELAHTANEIIGEFNEKSRGLKENCEKQKALFEKYDKTYGMYIGDTDDDVSRL